MEDQFRIALVSWLAIDPLLSASLNSVTEEIPTRTSAPWLAIAASGSIDWSTKERRGREVRVALELNTRGEEAGETAGLVSLIEDRLDVMPREQGDFCIASAHFLRARSQQRERLTRAVLLEYRFRLIAT